MNENKKIMSERFCKLDDSMSLEKLIRTQNEKIPVCGKVILWNSQAKLFKVDLGNGFFGNLPLELSTVYQTTFDDGRLTPAVRSIIGHTIIATVLCVDTSEETPKITLSRRENMLEAFDFLSKSIDKDIECCVTSISTSGVYVDCGNGISGFIHYTGLCTSRVMHFSEIVTVGNKITAKVISVDDTKFHVSLNYKDQFENLAFVLSPDDFIEAIILRPLNDSGYFVYLNPNTSAVVDVSKDIPCNYGDKVVARVKGRRAEHPEQLRLTFVSFIE